MDNMNNDFSQQNNNVHEELNRRANSNRPLILLLVLISLGLASYIVYDKVIEGNSAKNNDEIVDSDKENDDVTENDEPVDLSITSSLISSLYDKTKTECSSFRSFYYENDMTLRSNIKDTDLYPNITNSGCPMGGSYQTRIISAKQYSDKIEISEKHIYITLNNGGTGTSYVIYENVPDFNDKNSALDNIDTVSEADYTNSLVDNYLDKVSIYTFTFNKQNDGSYTLYSIEKES